jgi:two-component system, response regulator
MGVLSCFKLDSRGDTVSDPEKVEILLVEDNSADAELTLHAMRKSKLANNIELVRDGEEALDFLFCRGNFSHRHVSAAPRLILLDLKLPKVNGLQVLQTIKRDPRTRAIPVIILTSSKEERDLVNSYQFGVNSYIQKPVNFAEFQEVVRQLGMYWLLLNQPPPVAAFVPRLESAS